MNKLTILNEKYTISDWCISMNNNPIRHLYYMNKPAGYVFFEPYLNMFEDYYFCTFTGHLVPLSDFYYKIYDGPQCPYDKLEEAKTIVDKLIFKYFKLLVFV